MAIKPVKHFLSSHAGAPVLSGTAGSLIAVLDACLVNGYNLLTLDSLVVVDGVLTGTKAGHGFVPDQVIATTANEAALTGEWTITSVTSNTFTADATGVSNVTGTGSLTAKAAPLGWAKVYSGTNKAVYKSNDGSSSGMFLRVDDTGTKAAKVVGFETMTDVDTGTGRWPDATNYPSGLFWPKSSSASSAARGYILVGSSKLFHATYRYADTNHGTYYACFGDFVSEKQGDSYSCMLHGDASDTSGKLYANTQMGFAGFGLSSNSRLVAPRSYTQIGSWTALVCSTLAPWHSGSDSGLTFPSLANNGLILGPCALKEHSTSVLRALSVPGLYTTPQKLPLADLDVVSDISALPGRKVMTAALGIGGVEGRLFFDITGPW